MKGVLRQLGNRLGNRVAGELARLVDPRVPAAVELTDALIPMLLKIRRKDGALVALRANAAQQQYARRRGRKNIILKARQVGMTTYIAARLFLHTLLRPGTLSLQVAHSLESAQQIFRIAHRFYSNLPERIQDVIVTERANVRELAFAGWDSRFRVETAGNPGAGRGLTVHHLHASEVSEWPGDAQETMASLLAAVPRGGTVDIEATPKGVGGYFHREWMLAASGETGLVRHFFPWWIEPGYMEDVEDWEVIEPVNDVERALVEREKLTPGQLKYRRMLEVVFRGLRAQEYAENDVECFLASGRNVFDVPAADRRAALAPSPYAVGENGGELEWSPPEGGRRYVIGADPAGGHPTGDYSAAQVVDAETGMQCLELQARWPMERLAAYLARLGKRYNHALIAVERNNHGHAVNYALVHQHGYRPLYRHNEVWGASPWVECTTGETEVGWPTNAQTKPLAMGALRAMFEDVPEAIVSRRLLEEMRTLAYDEAGATRAPEGMHDDLVMAMAIAQAVRVRVARPAITFLNA